MSQADEFEELREDYAEKERQRHLRRRRKLWAGIRESGPITCQWLSPPANGPVATARIEFVCDGEEHVHEFTADATMVTNEGRQAYADPFYGKHGGRDKEAHRKTVEAYALWKWHTARGTPVDERDNLLVEPGFAPPVVKWVPPKVAKAA